MKSKIKKLERLWPLLVVFFVALIVFIFSVISIFNSDEQPSAESTDNTSPEISHSLSPETPSPSAVAAIPTSIAPTPSPSASPSPSPTASPAVTASPSPSPVMVEETPVTVVTAAPQYTTVIDNTVLEFTAEYDSVSSEENNLSNISSLIIRKINAERNSYGIAGLYYDDSLYYPATVRAQEMASSFSHTRPDGSECFTVFPDGYVYMGENLAEANNIISDEDFASGCVSFWMQSEGHRENILNSSFTGTAVGVYIDHGYMYAVQLFGTAY